MKRKGPPQIVLGGPYGAAVWKTIIVPILREPVSTRVAALLLGVSHNTVSIWRRRYL